MKWSETVTVLLLTWVHLARSDIDTSVCTPAKITGLTPPPPSLTITKLLSLRVEWREAISKRTYTMLEYSDDERKLGAITFRTPPQQDVKIVLDNANDVAMTIKLPNSRSEASTCTTTQLSSSMFRYDNKPWLTSIQYLYRNMINTKDIQFVQNSTVTQIRGYPVNEWSECMYDFSTNMTTMIRLFYLDRQTEWLTPHLTPDEPLLLSVMMHSKQHTGTGKIQEYSVIGDVFDLTSHPTLPVDAFTSPPGVFCPGRPEGKPFPFIQENFYVLMEQVSIFTITYDEIWYDKRANRVRHDTKNALGNDANPKSTIYDFDTGIRYVKDKYLGSCNPELIVAGDDYTAVVSNKYIALQNVSDLFNYNTRNIQYIGEMTTRGVLCDVWVGVYYDTNTNVNNTIQWYFTKGSYKEAVGTVVVPASFFRMDIWEGGTTQPVVHNIHKFTPVAQHWNTFDYGDCYNTFKKIHFVIQMKALDSLNMGKFSWPYLYDTIQEEIATQIKEEPNRLSDFKIEYDGGNLLYISGLFLDKSPIQNYHLQKQLDQHDLIPAFDFLRGNVETQFLMLVSNINGKPIRMSANRIDVISFPADFTTTTTQSTPSTSFRIPTIPIRVPTIPTRRPMTDKPTIPTTTIQTPSPRAKTTIGTTHPLIPSTGAGVPLSSSTTVQPSSGTSHKTTKVVIFPWTNPKPAVHSTHHPTCKPCQCKTVTCPPHQNLQCPTKAPVTTPAPRPCPSQTALRQPEPSSGVAPGAVAGAVIVSLILGAVCCVLALYVTSRFRTVGFLQHRMEGTETIPLGNY